MSGNPDTIIIAPELHRLLQDEMLRGRYGWWREEMRERLPRLTKMLTAWVTSERESAQ